MPGTPVASRHGAVTGIAVPDLAALAAAFGARLHSAGLPITPERSSRFAAVLALRPPRRIGELYWSARITLLPGHAYLAAFDEVFGEVFRGIVMMPPVPLAAPAPSPRARESGVDQPMPGSDLPASEATGGSSTAVELGVGVAAGHEAEALALAAASRVERLADKDFSDCTAGELAMIAQLVEQLSLETPPRPSRRSHRDDRGRRPDLRATLRRAGRTGGDPVHLVRRRRDNRRRRLVVIADVSGSMEPYSRVYLHLLRSAAVSVHAEVFVFATRLTRLTRLLSGGRTDAAYRAVARAARDWSGGTRIGDALTTFLAEHGRRGVARGAVVVIVSDGWDVGDPVVLAEAMQRLRRLAHRIVWVNPRSARPGFAPLVAGLRAALPYVDATVSGHSVSALGEVVASLADDADGSRARAAARPQLR